ncbi:MAG: hypothetical protein JNN11_05470, partial [Candidatus Doudnabacteria bacterium]|nr:hypothetical protein [Candidatus Doudnabacteria bacterium]
MKIRFVSVFLLFLVSASCSLFAQPQGAGLSKTVNGGMDWVLINKQDGGSGSMAGANISKLEFDPKSPEIVYSGSYNGGIFISQDSGETWKNILNKINVYDFGINANDTKVIYAAGAFGGVGKVLKTTDGGKSWVQKYSEAVETTPVRSMAINPSNQNNIIIGTESGNVIRSNDGGESWQFIKNFQSRIARVYWTGAGVFVLVRDMGLFKGSGVADDFKLITSPLKSENLLDQFSQKGAVGNFNQAYIDPFTSNLIYITSDKGLFKSTDGGVSWNTVKLPAKQED